MPKYVSPADIAEMKARGYEAATVEAAEEQSRRWHAAQAICRVIEEAFTDVTLGDGVGLRQARGLDDYADDATLAAYRAEDEKEDWRRIPAEALNHHHSSLSFFDAEGMRFHLPAYLVADLQGLYGFGMAFALTHLSDHGRCQFQLLTPAQRSATRAFLLFVAEDGEYRFYHSDIRRALKEYWTAPVARESADP